MKYFAFLLLTSTLLFSCSEEIEPSLDGKETAVVYSVLDVSDSIHFVKITRAFNTSGNLNEAAQIEDSSYFDNVIATITEVDNGTVTRQWTLKDTIITGKEEGTFYGPEQKMYYFKTSSAEPLRYGSSIFYKFKANINNTFEVSAITSLIGGMSISAPTEASQMSFATTNVAVNGYSNSPINFSPGNASKIEVSMNVRFDEFNGNTLVNTKSFDWKINDYEVEEIASSMSASALGKTFYTLIEQNCTKNDPTINKRNLKDITIKVTGASLDLQRYMYLNKPSSSLSQNPQNYTNLTVTNGMRVFGIFASKGTVSRYREAYKYAGGSSYYAALNTSSMRELCLGAITGTFFFCSENPTDVNQTFFCN